MSGAPWSAVELNWITRPASRQFCAKHCPLAPDGLKEDAKVETGAKNAKNTSPEDGLQKTVKVKHTIYSPIICAFSYDNESGSVTFELKEFTFVAALCKHNH